VIIDPPVPQNDLRRNAEDPTDAIQNGPRLTPLDWLVGDRLEPLRRKVTFGITIVIARQRVLRAAAASLLPAEVVRDEWGFVVTGTDLLAEGRATAWPLARPPMLLEASVPGIFVAGDVRHRSAKGVTSGVGEGAIAVKLVHEYLSTL